jgi:hypothetical protein
VFGSYRRDDFADPDSFLLQLGMVLERYSDDIIREVTSPVTGVQRRSKFPPAIAEMVEACDDAQERANRFRSYAQLGRTTFRRGMRPIDSSPGAWAQLFVPTTSERYAEMVERAASANPREWRYDNAKGGIWVTSLWWDEAPSARRVTVADLERLYQRQSVDQAGTQP